MSVLVVSMCSASNAEGILASYECDGGKLQVQFHDDWAEALWLGNSYELHKAVSIGDIVYLGEGLSIREDATHLELEVTNEERIHCVKAAS
jgi:hypothetical protein